MDWPEVERRIAAGEDARTEFKRGVSDLRGIGKTLCAFANGDGGLIVLGVEDATRAIVGAEADPEAVQKRLTSLLHTGCGKPVTARCGRARHRLRVGALDRRAPPSTGLRALRLRRPILDSPRPGDGGAVPVRASGVDERIRFRPHREAGRAVRDRGRRRLRRRAHLHAGAGAGPRPTTAAGTRRTTCATPALPTNSMARFAPTLYGLMVFGRDPQAYPHTLSLFVQCAAYGGADQGADVLSAGEGRGRLEDQVNRAMGWFRSLGRREVYRGLYRRDVPPMPEGALREALVNAVIHRDYAITGSPDPAGSVRRPHRGDEPRRIAEPHDRRAGADGRRPAFAQRDDGERHGRARTDGAARAGAGSRCATP